MRTRRTWEAILGYANANSEAEAAKKLHEAILWCEPRLAYEGASWISFFTADIRRYDAADPETAFRVLAVQYQPEFRDLLAYVVAPQRHPQFAQKVSEFLTIHGHGKSWNLDPYTLAPPNFDEESEDYSPVLFEWKVSYMSVVTPLAVFLLKQLDEWGGLDRTIPIRQCERQECGKFTLADRPRRKRYCSNLCGVITKQRDRSPEEWASYVWLHRLEKLNPAILRNRLKQKKTAERLRRIPEEWPQLERKAEAVKRHAGL